MNAGRFSGVAICLAAACAALPGSGALADDGAAALDAPAKGARLAVLHLNVADLDASAAFYSAAFGMEQVLALDMPGFTERLLRFRADPAGAKIALVGKPALRTPPDPGALRHFAITVDDVHAAVERVRSLGGQMIRAPFDVTVAGARRRIAIVADPEGHIVELAR